MTDDAVYAVARERHAQQRLGEARALYGEVLVAAPGHLGALYGLGVLALQERRFDEALGWLRRALAVDAADASGDIHAALASALRRSGDREGAAEAFGIVVARRPRSADAQLNLGAALADLHCYELAAEAFRRATDLHPDLVPAWGGLALALDRLGRPDEALAAAETGLRLSPDANDLLSVAASGLKALGRLDEAEARLRRVVEIRPQDRAAAFNLAGVIKDQGRTDEAVAAYRTLVATDPDDGAAQMGLCMAHLAALYRDDAEIDRRRAAYGEGLHRLAAEVRARGGDFLADGVGVAQPFALPYQGGDDLALQRTYGEMVCAAMAARFGQAPLPAPRAPGEKVRVGFVSGFFRDHANWRIPVQGWMRSLDRDRFEVFAYHTGAQRDAATAGAEALSDRFRQGPLAFKRWREHILADAPHVLIYPEIGMDPMAVRLAALRLAPVQANGWGHPVTSGLPTLDLFLSSEAMEPPGAEVDYSERLVRLAGLSAPVRLRHSGAPPERSTLRLRLGAVIFWCAQSPQKYLPGLDDTFPRIAEGAGDCQFVFAAFPGSDALTAMFQDRLHAAFARRGLEGERFCVIPPRLSPEAFAAAAGCADVVLDSLEWSGCNSLVDTLAHDLPIVALPGSRMRGRHGAAILQAMGLGDEVAVSLDDYIARAVSLARDPARRDAFSRRIAESKHRLETIPQGGTTLGEALLTALST